MRTFSKLAFLVLSCLLTTPSFAQKGAQTTPLHNYSIAVNRSVNEIPKYDRWKVTLCETGNIKDVPDKQRKTWLADLHSSPQEKACFETVVRLLDLYAEAKHCGKAYSSTAASLYYKRLVELFPDGQWDSFKTMRDEADEDAQAVADMWREHEEKYGRASTIRESIADGLAAASADIAQSNDEIARQQYKIVNRADRPEIMGGDPSNSTSKDTAGSASQGAANRSTATKSSPLPSRSGASNSVQSPQTPSSTSSRVPVYQNDAQSSVSSSPQISPSGGPYPGFGNSSPYPTTSASSTAQCAGVPVDQAFLREAQRVGDSCSCWGEGHYAVAWTGSDKFYLDSTGNAYITNASGTPSSSGGYITVSNSSSKYYLYFGLSEVINLAVGPHGSQTIPLSIYQTVGQPQNVRITIRARYCKQ